MFRPLLSSRRRSLEWLAAALFLLFVAALLAVALLRDYSLNAAAEEGRLIGQAKVVEENLVRQLEGVGGALSGVRDAVDPAGPTDWPAMSERMALLTAAMPGVRTMAILDAGGTVVASSRNELLGRNFRHREYFDVPLRVPDRATLYVSPPIKASLDGFVVFAGKAIVGPDGKFAGVVAATLNPGYFDVLLRSVLYAPDTRATLMHGDGKVFVNAPVDATVLGADLSAPDAVLGKLRRSGLLADLIRGSEFSTSEERLIALRTVDGASLQMDKPLVVAVSREVSAVLATWNERAARFALLFLLVLAASCGSLHASQRRRLAAGRLAAAAARERQEAAERLELALRGADLGLWDIRLPSGPMIVNARESRMLGYASAEELTAGTAWQHLIHPDDRPAVHAAMAGYLKGRRATFDCEHRVRHRDGHWLWVSSRAMVTERDARGRALRVIGTHLDITQRKRADAELASASARLCKSEERLALALEGSGLALFDWDMRANVIFHSAQAAALRGEEPLERSLSASEAREHVHPDDLPGMLANIRSAVTGAFPHYHAEFRLQTISGHWVWVRARGRVVERDARTGRALRMAGTYANIDERKQIENRLRHLAEFDPLTDLPNRALFHDRLRLAMSRTKPSRGLAVLFLDIDHFKRINDTLGHEAGDQLLKEFARRMQDTVRLSDTVARLAGDEFTIILENLRDARDAQVVAGKLVTALCEPVVLEGVARRVTASIGVSTHKEGDTADALLRRADAALYEAKRRGRNGFILEREDGEASEQTPEPGPTSALVH
jgi:diguanylate cyclase (GGDEF)-like protein/PAS domain S-box-containing protein